MFALSSCAPTDRTFQPLRDGLPGEVRKLIQDPTNPRVLYALTLNDGIYTFTRGR